MVKKILLIDDDADDRELFCDALSEIDPQIICYTATGGYKALEKLDHQEIIIPDIIFIDINMPGMNGWQCISVLKEQESYKHIPMIMYSTTSHTEDIEKAQSMGALCFFTKPSNFKELKKSMELVVSHLNSGSLSSLMLVQLCFLTTSF